MSDDPFYIGYQDRAPASLGRWLRTTSLALVVVGAAFAVGLVLLQRPFDPGIFEFQEYRTFEGVVQEVPYPMLVVERPGPSGSAFPFSQYYLVHEDKAGAQASVRGLAGRLVRLRGSLIYRDDQTMIAVQEGTVEPLDQEAAGPLMAADLGTYTLRGEIIDSKCFLGVMKPGDTKAHRACAALCIRGGIPPMLVVRDGRGTTAYLLLVGTDGRAVNHEVLPYVAEPVELTGAVVRLGGVLTLHADPASIQRLR